MNRYQDNTSPEPSIGISLNECYKTPNLQYNLNSIININQLYPTPPSENEENSFHHDRHIHTKHDNLVTPTIPTGSYYGVNIINKDMSESQDGSILYNQSNTSLDEQTQYTKKPASSEAQPQQQVSSRFKRRSRTTYTKSQLDALEATFQKTHYPEIRAVDDLSQMLNLSTERISIWFQNRRARFKKARKLETQENRYLSETTNTYTNSYPIGNCYPTPTYNQFYSNDNKSKNVPKVIENSSPIVSSNKIENYPQLNKNLINNFSSSAEPTILNNIATNQNINNQSFYSHFSNLQYPTGNNIPYYQNQIPSQLSQNGFYQPIMNFSMGYPSYQNQNIGL